jgi:hypothetical protein
LAGRGIGTGVAPEAITGTTVERSDVCRGALRMQGRTMVRLPTKKLEVIRPRGQILVR